MAAYAETGEAIGKLVEDKQVQYGDSFAKSADIMRVLYPHGITHAQMVDALAVVRIIDKLFRIGRRGQDGVPNDTESPYRDIAGYAILGATADEAEAAARRASDDVPF